MGLRLVLFAALFSAGCAQTLSTVSLEKVDAAPGTVYAAFTFRSDAGEKVRVVFLKSPGSDVEVVPYSQQITATRITLQEALAFLDAGRSDYTLSVEEVFLAGRRAGYLLTSVVRSAPRFTEVNLFARGGEVYISISRPGY